MVWSAALTVENLADLDANPKQLKMRGTVR
jgi:hypothetical protein